MNYITADDFTIKGDDSSGGTVACDKNIPQIPNFGEWNLVKQLKNPFRSAFICVPIHHGIKPPNVSLPIFNSGISLSPIRRL